jgi:serine/threonine protein kinase/Flp pilus assembly protein TadD
MSHGKTDATARDERLHAVLAACLEADESKPGRNWQQMLLQYPEFAPELTEFFTGRKQFDRLFAPLRPLVQAAATPPPDPVAPTMDAITSVPPDPPVRSFGDYELLQEIGRGGMGVVYKARQKSLHRFVALKMIHAGELATEAQVQRFRNEAEMVATLDHPRIVPIYEVGQEAGQLYFTMKLIKGGSLAQHAGDFCLPLCNWKTGNDATGTHWSFEQIKNRKAAIAQLLAAVARAVHHAHRRGILHRDLKPSNILLDKEGQPYVTDFGLAKRVRKWESGSGEAADRGNSKESGHDSASLLETPLPAAAAAPPPTLPVSHYLTQANQLVGTPSYMAPEQASGQKGAITTATDVYALGVTLYVMLTGRPPFQGATVLATLEQIKQQAAKPPSQYNRHVDPDLEAICLKCLAKEPERRYGSAAAMAEDLELWLAGKPVRARWPTLVERGKKWVWRHRAVVVTATAATVVLLVLAVIGLLISHHLIDRQRDEASKQRDEANRQRQEAEAARKEAIANLKIALQAVDQMLMRVANEQLLYVPKMEQVRRELLKDALKFCQQLLATKSDDPELRRETGLAYGRLGRIHHKIGQQAEAEQALCQGIAVLEALSAEGALGLPGREELLSFYNYLGWVLARLGRHGEKEAVRRKALAQAEQLAAEFPDNPRYRNQLAGTYIDLGNACRMTQPQEAETLYRRAIALTAAASNRHYHGRAHLALGELLAEGGQLPAAEDAFRQARAIFDASIRVAPKSWQSRDLLGEAHRLLGRVLAATGRLTEAEQAIRQAMVHHEKLRTDFATVADHRDALAKDYADLILLLTATDRPQAAEEAYRQLAPLEPGHPVACNNVAWLLATCPEPRFRDPPRAVQLARRAVELDPQAANHWRTLGAAHYRAGDGQAAVAALEKALDLRNRGESLDWFFLSMACWLLDEGEKARQWYDLAVQWMDENQPKNPVLHRLRAESATLLGIKDQPEQEAKEKPHATPQSRPE